MASAFNIEATIESAKRRFGRQSMTRRQREDIGRPRVSGSVMNLIAGLLEGYERPPIKEVMHRLEEQCGKIGLTAPSRATLYKVMSAMKVHEYPVRDLPPGVRDILYNLDDDTRVPGHQLAFYCFNYGSMPQVCFGAGLPWIDLYQAARMRGWRPRSRGLLKAAMLARGI